MGQDWSSDDLPEPGIEIDRIKQRSGNCYVTQAQYHTQSSGGRAFKDDYAQGSKVLGRGRHTVVLLARSRLGNGECAVKAFDKMLMSDESLSLMAAEVEIHLTLDHPGIVRLYDIYEQPNRVVVVMEHCKGGELFDELSTRVRFDEPAAAEVGRQMINAMSYLHTHNVVHRDLKLENWLYADTNRQTLKLIDFGFSKVWSDADDPMYAPCGTTDYVAPEVLLHEGYNNKCDMWSLGVIIFMLLSGAAPLHAEKGKSLQSKIKHGDVDWGLLDRKCTISPEARDFLSSLLVMDPQERLDSRRAIFHPWLVRTKAVPDSLLGIGSGILRSLATYNALPRVEKAALQLIARRLLPDEVPELTRVFLLLAELGGGCSGTICLNHFEDALSRGGGTVYAALGLQDGVGSEAVEFFTTLFGLLDFNRDNQVYYSDWIAATLWAEMDDLRDESLQRAFRFFDADDSGQITAEDLGISMGGSFENITAEELLLEVDNTFGKAEAFEAPNLEPEGLTFEAFRQGVLGGSRKNSECDEALLTFSRQNSRESDDPGDKVFLSESNERPERTKAAVGVPVEAEAVVA
mmetsp:Transcript_121377/g.259155  ORF Transcript_121377/g.259155 Transcript_121377/m.259155 type:complete len:575 (+) Transcript_121377:107-1831(+)